MIFEKNKTGVECRDGYFMEADAHQLEVDEPYPALSNILSEGKVFVAEKLSSQFKQAL